jgi:hypothetical protein
VKPLAMSCMAAALASTAVFAGDDTALIERIALRQQRLDRYAVDMDIRVTGGEASSLAIAARALRDGPVHVQEFQNYLVMIRPEIRVVVDRADRTIHLNAAAGEAPQLPAVDPARILATAREAGYELRSATADDVVTLTFTADGRPSYELVFDAQDLRLQRMEMHAPTGTGEPMRTVVTYAWREVGEDARLTTDYYVRRAGKDWQPAPTFSGYRIVVARER